MRGNGKIIQELEAAFRGAGWNVIKVIWGSDWDPLLEARQHRPARPAHERGVDGEYQKYTVEAGAYIREHFFGKYPELLELVEELLRRAAPRAAPRRPRPGQGLRRLQGRRRAHRARPTVILAKTVKGYGLGEAGEGRNVTHQQKKLNEEELRVFRDRFDIPISDEDVAEAPFYRPADDSPEMQYLRERRKALGGYVPEPPRAHRAAAAARGPASGSASSRGSTATSRPRWPSSRC